MLNWRNVYLLYKKEILEFVRDRRTLLIMIFIPALLYPGILIVTSELSVVQNKKMKTETYTVGTLKKNRELKIIKKLEKNKKIKVVYKDKIENKDVSLFIEFTPKYTNNINTNKTGEINLHYNNANTKSRYALTLIDNIFYDYAEKLKNKRLKALGIPKETILPLKINRIKLAKMKQESRYIAGRILPGIMLIMLAVGCSLIAQEITAGEKERGTLETILCSPISRFEVVMGKYLTVASVGMFSGLINLASMGFTISNLSGSSGKNIFSSFSFPLVIIPILIICLAGISFLVTGLTMIASSLARTAQEASQYMIPVVLLLSVPIIFSSMPGVELTGSILYVPFLNFCLLFQEMMLGTYNPLHIFAVIVSTLCFTGMSLYALVKIFNSEEILFNHEGKFSFTFKRNMLTEKNLPEASDSLLLFCISATLLFFVGLPAQAKNIVIGLLFSEWILLLGGTIFFLKYLKINLKNALKLKPFKFLNLPIVIALAILCMILMQQLAMWLSTGDTGGEEQKQMIEMFKMFNQNGLFFGIFCIGITAGVCEELLFRGAILSGLQKQFSTRWCIILQGLMFGMIHFSLLRLPVTFIMGCLLAYIAIKSRSVIPGVILHTIYNSLSYVFSIYQIEGKASELPLFIQKIAEKLNWGTVTILCIFIIILVFSIKLINPHEKKENEQI